MCSDVGPVVSTANNWYKRGKLALHYWRSGSLELPCFNDACKARSILGATEHLEGLSSRSEVSGLPE